MVGQIPKVSGSVEVYGSVAYVSQEPWIQNATLRDNILFGREYNKVSTMSSILFPFFYFSMQHLLTNFNEYIVYRKSMMKY